MGNLFLPGLLSMINYRHIFSEMGAQLKSKWVSGRAAEKTSSTAQDLPTFFPMECSSEHWMGLVDALWLLLGMFPSYTYSPLVFVKPFLITCTSCSFRASSAQHQDLRSSIPTLPSSANSANSTSITNRRLTRHFHLLNQAFELLLCQSRQVQSDRTRVRLCRA